MKQNKQIQILDLIDELIIAAWHLGFSEGEGAQRGIDKRARKEEKKIKTAKSNLVNQLGISSQAIIERKMKKKT